MIINTFGIMGISFSGVLLGVVITAGVLTPLILFIRHNYNQAKESANDLGSITSEKLKSDVILNAIGDGVILVDDQKLIRLFNPAATTITGWNINDAIGLDYHNVIQLENDNGQPYSDQECPINKVFETGASSNDSKSVLVTHANKRIALNLSVSPLVNEDQEVVGAVGIFRDISKEKGDLERRAEFISTASHEMRTPVAAIEGYLALALNENVSRIDTKAREYLLKAHESTQLLGKLFQDLLTSAKAEDGRLSNHPVVIEMGAFMEQMAEALKFSASKKGLMVEFVVGADTNTIDASNPNAKVVHPLYLIHADPDRMREIVTNIFDNSVKYTESGKISIGVTGDEEVVQIRVADTGPGIPAEDVPHLFEKFYRVDNSATRTVGGTGLGLFICRKIIELYNGRLWVDSTVGKGSTFFINIPRLSTPEATKLQSVEATRSPLAPV